MCVVSMVTDHYWGKWTTPILPSTGTQWPYILPIPSAAEVAEFRELLQKAREYDKQHNQPNCELAEKKARIKALANELGIDISFIDEV